MSEYFSRSERSVTVEDFGIDPERPLLQNMQLTRIDENCYSHDAVGGSNNG
jgi:hypothetical protein